MEVEAYSGLNPLVLTRCVFKNIDHVFFYAICIIEYIFDEIEVQ